MDFLGNIGIDLWLLGAQVINFLFLLWILSKFIYKPLIARIEKDEKIIEEVSLAQLALEKKEDEIIKKEKIYSIRSKNKARKIISEAEEIATSIKKTAKKETEIEKMAVISQINTRLEEIHHEH